MTRLFASMLALFLASTSAEAAWQWTEWGMSPDAVLEASNGRARPTTSKEASDNRHVQGDRVTMTAQVTAPHDAGGQKFQAFFLFDPESGGLKCVELEPRSGVSVSSLKGDLTSAYGMPADEVSQTLFGGMTLHTTSWLTADTKVDLKSGSLGTKILYCARKTAKGSGY